MSDGMFDPGLALLFLGEEGQNDSAAAPAIVALVAAAALALAAGLLSLTGTPII